MGPQAKHPSFRPVLVGLSIAAISIGVGCGYALHQPNESSPEGLLKRADDLAWKNQWIAAEPLYERARTGFLHQNMRSKALYAEVSEIPVGVEHGNVPHELARLTADLQRPEASDPRTKLRILEILGMLETNYDAAYALKTWTEVGRLATQQGRLLLVTRATGEQGIAAYLLGDLSTAKTKVGAAWKIAQYGGDPGAHIRYASMFGAGEVDQHQYKAALSALDEAIDTASRTGSAYPTIAVYAKIEALAGLGQYQEALQLTDEAEKKVRQYDLKPHLVDIGRLRANTFVLMNNPAAAIVQYDSAIKLAKQIGYWRAVMQDGEELAGVYEQLRDFKKALVAVDLALDASTHIPEEVYLTPRILARKADILAKMNRTHESNALYQQAADVLDAFLLKAPTVNIERSLIVELGHVYSGYFSSLCDQGLYPEAFAILEKGRGRIETQALEHHQSADPTHLSSAEQSLALLNTTLLRTDDEAKRASLLKSIATTENTLETSALAERASDTPVALHDLQKDLTPDELILEYSLDDRESYVLAVTDADVKRYPLGPRRDLESSALRYRSLLSKGKSDTGIAQDLFTKLLGVAPEYKVKRAVILVPDGKLALLPYAALMDGANYVIADHVISTVPSGTVLHLIRTRSQTKEVQLPYLGVAAWTKPSSPLAIVRREVRGPEESDFIPLPQSRTEVENVAADLPKPSRILLGSEANETEFKALPLHEYNVLHLALHGFADPDYPDRSSLVFAPDIGGVNDGLLQVREIRHLDLNASLVTLSACDTGVGPTGQAGVANIANAFIEAGGRTVVSTLWALDDRATSKLMSEFYARLIAGSTKGEALALAQLSLARAGVAPYYWASFEIVGDPSGPLYSAGHSSTSTAVASTVESRRISSAQK